MGRRGPAPEPASVRMAKGETRPSQLNQREPLPRAGGPRMPSDMSAEAKAVWRSVVREMGPSRAITGADAFVLRCFCEAMVSYVDAQKLIASTGLLVKRDGNLVKTPLHQIRRDERDAVRLFGRELGLSPAARAGLQMELERLSGEVEDEIGPPPRFRVVGGSDD